MEDVAMVSALQTMIANAMQDTLELIAPLVYNQQRKKKPMITFTIELFFSCANTCSSNAAGSDADANNCGANSVHLHN
jgi:hypothetical protein